MKYLKIMDSKMQYGMLEVATLSIFIPEAEKKGLPKEKVDNLRSKLNGYKNFSSDNYVNAINDILKINSETSLYSAAKSIYERVQKVKPTKIPLIEKKSSIKSSKSSVEDPSAKSSEDDFSVKKFSEKSVIKEPSSKPPPEGSSKSSVEDPSAKSSEDDFSVKKFSEKSVIKEPSSKPPPEGSSKSSVKDSSKDDFSVKKFSEKSVIKEPSSKPPPERSQTSIELGKTPELQKLSVKQSSDKEVSLKKSQKTHALFLFKPSDYDVFMISKESCPYCVDAEKLIIAKQKECKSLTFKKWVLLKDGTFGDEKKDKWHLEEKQKDKTLANYNRVPQIWIKGKFVGGLEQLKTTVGDLCTKSKSKQSIVSNIPLDDQYKSLVGKDKLSQKDIDFWTSA